MEFGGCALLSKHHSNCQGFNWQTGDKHQMGDQKELGLYPEYSNQTLMRSLMKVIENTGYAKLERP